MNTVRTGIESNISAILFSIGVHTYPLVVYPHESIGVDREHLEWNDFLATHNKAEPRIGK